MAGIAESTYYEWCKADSELSERMKALKSKLILKARQTLSDNLDDVSTAKWLLERRCKNEFSTKTESTVEHIGGVMAVPFSSSANEWGQLAQASQAKLKHSVKD